MLNKYIKQIYFNYFKSVMGHNNICYAGRCFKEKDVLKKK